MRADDEELGAAVHEQIMHKYQSLDKRNCIVLSSQADWEAHEARILQALASSPRFKRYYRCHCFSETLSSAPFLAYEPQLVGVPSIIEYLLHARVFLSGISHATPAVASQLNLGCIRSSTSRLKRPAALT